MKHLNPTSNGSINLLISDSDNPYYSYSLWSAQGQLITSGDISNYEFTLKNKSLVAGMYIIHLQKGNGEFKLKKILVR